MGEGNSQALAFCFLRFRLEDLFMRCYFIGFLQTISVRRTSKYKFIPPCANDDLSLITLELKTTEPTELTTVKFLRT